MFVLDLSLKKLNLGSGYELAKRCTWIRNRIEFIRIRHIRGGHSPLFSRYRADSDSQNGSATLTI